MLDISKIETADLQELLKRIPEELKEREVRARAKALEELSALAKAHGYTIEQLIGEQQNTSKKKRRANGTANAAAPRYAKPGDPSTTWTGVGRKPEWVKEHLAKGASLESIRVTAETPAST